MKKVGVIGGGVMGRGVAQSLGQSGYQVILVDILEDILKKASDEIYNNVRFQAFFNKNKDLPTPEQVLEKIEFTTDYQRLREVDYVIENVSEKWETKKTVYEKIDNICPQHCVFLVNTSCIPITRIGALTKRPQQVIGTHFMNPVPLMAAVETIRGFYTTKETIETVKKLLESMGKEMILVNDLPGFVSNRISHLFMNEAAFVVQDQVASPQEVDEVFKKCYGHKMGPLETADLIGLDTVVDSLDVLYENYQDPKFRCCPLLRKMVDAGLYGRKSGQGFYSYQN